VHVVGRAAIPTDEVRAVVGKRKNRIKAFNLFDGKHTLQEVAHQAKIDQGNLSRSAARWVDQGIAFWIGEGRDARLLHIYAIPEKERIGAR
jgi:hypothetical protein